MTMRHNFYVMLLYVFNIMIVKTFEIKQYSNLVENELILKGLEARLSLLKEGLLVTRAKIAVEESQLDSYVINHVQSLEKLRQHIENPMAECNAEFEAMTNQFRQLSSKELVYCRNHVNHKIGAYRKQLIQTRESLHQLIKYNRHMKKLCQEQQPIQTDYDKCFRHKLKIFYHQVKIIEKRLDSLKHFKFDKVYKHCKNLAVEKITTAYDSTIESYGKCVKE